LGGVLSELLEQRLQLGVCGVAGHARLQQNVDDVPAARGLHQLERKKDVGAVPGESRRRHAHDDVVLLVQLQCLSQHGPISEEVLLPKLVRKHNYRLRLLAIRSV
jgi:hypothetical protein